MMMKQSSKNEGGFGPRWLGKFFILIVAVSLLACVAAIPVVVYYEEQHKGFVVTVQLDEPSDKVYQAAIEVIENPPKTEPMPGFVKITNIKKDDQKLTVKFDAVFKDGTHHDRVNVTAIGANRSQLVAVSDTPGDKKADQSSAIRTVRVICDKLGVKYKLVKG